MKNTDIRGMLKLMREYKKSDNSLIKEQNVSLDDATSDSIKELFPEGVVVNNISVSENKKESIIIGEILSLDIDFNMLFKKSINESDCTIDFRKLTENSTVFSVDQDFVESLMEIGDLYNTYKQVHEYIIENNILSYTEDKIEDEQD
jgi:hypothetical protein